MPNQVVKHTLLDLNTIHLYSPGSRRRPQRRGWGYPRYNPPL